VSPTATGAAAGAGWPRLSEDLPGPRVPGVCQKCGRTRRQVEEAGLHLQLWREHSEQADRPEEVYLYLCTGCDKEHPARGIVSRHPRYYSRMATHAPIPGTMPLCAGCRWRGESPEVRRPARLELGDAAEGLACRCPAAKASGGPGIVIDHPEPFGAHFKAGAASGFYTLFPGPALRCSGREEHTPTKGHTDPWTRP